MQIRLLRLRMERMMSRNNEIFDYKRFVLLNIKRMAAIFIFAAIFAVIAGALYYVKAIVLSGPDVYRCQAFYYITFDREEFEAVHDYYNDFTWNDVLDRDVIAGKAAERTGISKDRIAKMTSVPTMSDIRMIHVYVDSEDKDEAVLVQNEIASALYEFSEYEPGFDHIDKWDGPEVFVLEKEFHIVRILVFAAVLGAIFGFLYVLYKNATDTKVYTMADIEAATGIPSIGIAAEKAEAELMAHIKEIKNKNSYKKLAVINAESMCEKNAYDISSKLFDGDEFVVLKNDSEDFYDKLKDCDGVIVLVSFGRIEKQLLAQAVNNLKIYDKQADMLVLADVDDKFIKMYYSMGK